MKEHRPTREATVLVASTAAIVICLLGALATWTPFDPIPQRESDRFGVCVSPRYGTLEDLPPSGLRFGWYYDYQFQISPARPGGVQYAQLVWGYPPDWAKLAFAVLLNRGSLWIVGNEPDNQYQDGRTPQEYARVYHDVYWFVKRLDSAARVAVGGVSQPTPLRLQWLDMALSAYQERYGHPMPVDVWNIHASITREEQGSWGSGIPVGLAATEGQLCTIEDSANADIFAEYIRTFRRWMRERGYQDKPLIVSEFGVLQPAEYGFPPERVVEFMEKTCRFMLEASDPELGCPSDGYRLVQRWAWFSLNEPPWDGASGQGFNGELLDRKTGTLTLTGRAYNHLVLEASRR